MVDFTSDFAVIEIKRGRATMAHKMNDVPRLGICPEKFRVPVVITGYIDRVSSSDDGVSQGFTVTVTKLKIGDDK